MRCCVNTGVKSLRIGHDFIEVDFQGPKPKAEKSPKAATKAKPLLEQTEFLDQVEHDPQDDVDKDEIEELQLTDPLEYEARLARGELIDAEKVD